MQDIIEKLLNENSSKERSKLIEQYRNLNFNRNNEEAILEVYKKARELLENGNEKEKIIALRVIGATFIIFPISETIIRDFENFSNSSEKIRNMKKRSTNYDEIADLTNECFELMKSDDGNLRLASAHVINHLRGYMSDYDYVQTFYDLMCLNNYYNKKKDKKRKTAEFCLDKIFCPHLEMAIEEFMPNTLKKVKINVPKESDEEQIKVMKRVEDIINNMVKETEKKIKRVMSFRGEFLFEKELIPYLENMEIIQIMYEVQRLKQMLKNGEIDGVILRAYSINRILRCLNIFLSKIEKVKEKESWECITYNLKQDKFALVKFSDVYQSLKDTISAITNLMALE